MTSSFSTVLVMFMATWRDEDWKAMRRYVQRTWLSEHDDDLWELLDTRPVYNYSIVSAKIISDCLVSITVRINDDYNIVANVICESALYNPDPNGQWGVNPTSCLKEIN